MATAQVVAEAVVAWKGWVPTKNCMSRRAKGVVTVSVPPDRIDRALTSSGVNPTWGPMVAVAVRSALVISALRTMDQVAPL